MEAATSTTLVEVLPTGFWFLGEILFRWIPATVSVVVSDVTGTGSPFVNLTSPVELWDVPRLLQMTAADPGTYVNLVKSWYTFSLITLLASIPFLALVLYCWIRILQIRRAERRELEAKRRVVVAEGDKKTQLRWNRITEEATSSTPEKWRLAILEADIMLNELLDLQGYKGETMADKMKQVDKAKFNSIDLAWEAHKVRNVIAHEGTTFDLSAREVRRIIGLYERVFREFKFID